MSIREATQLPVNNGLQNTDSTSSTDATGSGPFGPSAPASGHTTSTASAPSFWDQERDFQSKEDERQNAIGKIIDAKVLEAASPLDSDGGKQVAKGAGLAGMPMPSKHMLRKVKHAIKDAPEMKKLERFVRQGLSGKGEDLATPAGAHRVMHLAAQVGERSGLLSSEQAKAYSNLSLSATTGAAAQPAALGAGAPQAENLTTKTDNLTQGTTFGGASHPTGNMGVSITSAPPASSRSGAPSYLSGGNLAAIVMIACSQSMDEDNKIKAGQLNDMQKYNHISSLISGYISNVLQPAQAELDKKTAGETDSGKVAAARVTVDTWNNIDADDLFQDKNGNFVLQKSVTADRLSNTGLSTALSAAQGSAQTASNNSEQASNRFQATDNQSNQTFTMLTGLLKAINDSTSAIGRNVA